MHGPKLTSRTPLNQQAAFLRAEAQNRCTEFQFRSYSGTALSNRCKSLRSPNNGAHSSTIPSQRYHCARMYDPALGRFISRDPLGYIDGMSLYRAYFVPGDVDPFGLCGADSLTSAIRRCASLPTPALRIKCLQDLMLPETKAKLDPLIKAQEALKRKLEHIFHPKKHDHRLDDLVRQFGSEEALLNHVNKSARQVVERKGLRGVFEELILVRGNPVVVRGTMYNGNVRIGTFFVQ